MQSGEIPRFFCPMQKNLRKMKKGIDKQEIILYNKFIYQAKYVYSPSGESYESNYGKMQREKAGHA